MEIVTLILWVLAILLVLAGLAGSILPVLPGIPMVFAGLFLAAWAGGFDPVGFWTLTVLGLLTVASVVVDFAATALGTRRFGAGRAAIIGATLGMFVGMFFGLPGIIVGPFAGAFSGHVMVRGTLPDSARAGVGAWVGVLVGSVAKVLIGLLMVAIFIVAWLTGGA